MATIKDILAAEQEHHPVEFADAFLELIADREEAIPDALREQVRVCARYKLPELKKLVEMVFAAISSESEECGPILLTLCARLAEWFDVHGSLGMAGRGIPISTVLLIAAGKKVPALPEGKEPKPLVEFMPVESIAEEEIDVQLEGAKPAS